MLRRHVLSKFIMTTCSQKKLGAGIFTAVANLANLFPYRFRFSPSACHDKPFDSVEITRLMKAREAKGGTVLEDEDGRRVWLVRTSPVGIFRMIEEHELELTER